MLEKGFIIQSSNAKFICSLVLAESLDCSAEYFKFYFLTFFQLELASLHEEVTASTTADS